LHVRHANYRLPLPAEFSFSGLGDALALGLACGLLARLYLYLHRRNSAAKSLPNPYGRILFGGILFVLLVQFGRLHDFTGLGLNVISESFVEPIAPAVFALKFLLTFLCVSYGFRGGEVTPLFFVGVTLGSAAAAVLSLPLTICAALGFVGVFAGAGAVPIACTIMACELFGLSIGGYALITCATSWLVAGRKGLYDEA
jgi:H+/Cl- antiporter ClcA